MTPTVAALFVDPRGPYPSMPGVDAWDEKRDARKYAGPWPVVAHPPCAGWGRLRHLAKLSLEHHVDCAIPAVRAVRSYGGVLEQPAGSKMFEYFGMPRPGELPDKHGGYSIDVNQVEWGHVASKPTWLYIVGAPKHSVEQPPFPGRKPTHGLMGGRGKNREAWARLGLKETSAEQRRITPKLFAEYLVRLAQAAHVARAERVA